MSIVFSKVLALSLIVFLFFLLMARIDFIVNQVLYNYGLHFSYEWANAYWLAFDSAFAVFAAAAGLVSWFCSQRTCVDKRVAVALFVSINMLAVGGLEDLLYFSLWSGGLPSNGVVWWWSHWTGIFGTWNSVMQLQLLSLMTGLSVLVWVLALRGRRAVSSSEKCILM